MPVIRAGGFSVVSLPGSLRLRRALSWLHRFLGALKLLKNAKLRGLPCGVTSQRKQLVMRLIFKLDNSHPRGLNSDFRFLYISPARALYFFNLNFRSLAYTSVAHGFPLMEGQSRNVWKLNPKYSTFIHDYSY